MTPNFSRIQNILFDLDGTLTDSVEGIWESMRYALEALCLQPPTHEQVRATIGAPLHRALAHFVPETHLDEAQALYHDRYKIQGHGIKGNCAFDGVPELMENLQKAGKNLFVATTKSEDVARKVMDFLDLSRFCQDVCGTIPDTPRNSKGTVIAHLIKTYALPLESTIMVGDRHYDIEGAKANNIPCLTVAWGYAPPSEKTQAPHLVATPQNLEDLILRGTWPC